MAAGINNNYVRFPDLQRPTAPAAPRTEVVYTPVSDGFVAGISGQVPPAAFQVPKKDVRPEEPLELPPGPAPTQCTPPASPSAPILLTSDDFLLAGSNLAEPFRVQARSLLAGSGNPNSAVQVELTALSLFEKQLSQAPRTLTVIPNDKSLFPAVTDPQALQNQTAEPINLKSLAHSSAYTGSLAACLAGQSAALTPAVLSALDGFNPALLFSNRLQNGSHFRALGGEHSDTFQASQATDSQTLASGVKLHGSWSPEESRIVEAAAQKIHDLVPAARGLLKSVVIRTHIGSYENEKGESLNQAFGEVDGDRPGEVVLHRQYLVLDPGRAERTIFHEVGHLLDQKLGEQTGGRFYSEQTSNPLTRSRNLNDCVTEYASMNPVEDFAETFADVLRNWEKNHSDKGIGLYSRGEVATKRRWMMEHIIGAPVPPPSQTWKALVQTAQQPDSPFGWKTDSGTKVGAEKDLSLALGRLSTYSPEKLEAGKFPPEERAKFQWLAAHVEFDNLPPLGGTKPAQELPPQSLTALQSQLQACDELPGKLQQLRAQLPGHDPMAQYLERVQARVVGRTLRELRTPPTRTEIQGLVAGLSLNGKPAAESHDDHDDLSQALLRYSRELPVPQLPQNHPLTAQVVELERNLAQTQSQLKTAVALSGGEVVEALQLPRGSVSRCLADISQDPHNPVTL